MAATTKRPVMYLLLNGKPKPIFNVARMDWGERHQSERERQVADDFVRGSRISTVFLGVDHNWDPDGDPILFETMIFGGRLDGHQERYTTIEAARAGHNKACVQALRASRCERRAGCPASGTISPTNASGGGGHEDHLEVSTQ